jgi:hypothetical protein
MRTISREPWRSITTSPARRSIDGMLALRPFTVKWPWRTSWRASARDVAKPSRYTTLSSRPLEQHEQVLAGAALHVQRAVHRARELLLEQAVHPAHLLLLAQLHAEVGEARAALAVLSGRIAAALDAALRGEAAVALQEELGAFPTAEPTHCIVVASHSLSSRRAGASSAGNRCGGSA